MPKQRRQGHLACTWLSDAELAAVDDAARRDRIIKVTGEPNRSAMIRRLLVEALEQRKES